MHDVNDSLTAAAAAWDAFVAAADPDQLSAALHYESAVRHTGSLVAAQIDDRIRKQLGEFDDAAWTRDYRAWLDDIATLKADRQEHSKWEAASIARLRRNPAELDEIQREASARADALNARIAVLQARRQELDDQLAERGAAEGEISRTVLAQYRPYGTHTPAVHARTAARPRLLLAEASRFFPDAWMAASDTQDRMVVKETSGRAHYTARALQTYTEHHDHQYDVEPYQTGVRRKADLPLKPQIDPGRAALDSGLGYGTFRWAAVRDPGTETWQWQLRESRKRNQFAPELLVPAKSAGAWAERTTPIHELSHRVETHDLRIPFACKTFRYRRSANPDGSSPPLQQYAPGEMVHPDTFVSNYVGKEYKGTHHTEVLSMGMEAVFGGAHGSLLGRQGHRADHEHRHLILGLCASV